MSCPIIWHDRTKNWTKTINGATCFFIQYGDNVFGITANHVVATYIDEFQLNTNLVCQLKDSFIFDLIKNIIDRDEKTDLATFSVPMEILKNIDVLPIDCSGMWPPPDLCDSASISACGFPKLGHFINSALSGIFEAWGALAIIESYTEKEILFTYDPNVTNVADWAPKAPPLGINMSGCSGGPVLMHCIRNGIHRWFPVALITDGPKGDHKKGEMESFDIIRARRINIIDKYGKIKREKENMGWLPQ